MAIHINCNIFQEHRKVSELIKLDGTWDSEHSDQFFLLDYAQTIREIPLPKSQCEDRPVWNASGSSKLRIKYVIIIAVQQDQQENER